MYLSDHSSRPIEQPMRLLHVIRTLHPDAGGPSESVRMFALAHQNVGNVVEVATLDAPGSASNLDAPQHRMQCQVHALGPGAGTYGFSARLEPWLVANRHRFDGAIVDGVWQYHGVAARRAFAGKLPYVVFSHGMLDPYFMRRFPLKHLKKLAYWMVEERRNLNQANAVCMTSQEEVRTAGEGFPFCRFKRVLVPYGSAGPEGDPAAQREAFLRAWPELAGKQFLLFLGRIHPKKGCDLLLEAFARAAAPEMRLVMAGPDEVGWTAELRSKAEQLGIAGRITWTGMLRGDEKWGSFYAAEAFILPSHQENFGIAVADAMACGLVPLVSDKVNIAAEIAGDDAGLMETDTVEGTARLIARFQAMSEDERGEMRRVAKACYQRRYSLADSPHAVNRALGLE